MIALDAALVDRALVFRGELLRTAFERQCRQALSLLPDSLAIGDRVRRFLADVADSKLVMSKVAARLRMSGRTLQRKLRAEGTSFQQLADAVRRERAEGLLRAGSSKKEVALHLGFSDPSGFLRARRRWRRDSC